MTPFTRIRLGKPLGMFLLGALCFGCPYLRRTKTPMEAVHFVSQGPDKARGVIVLLPGFGDGPDAFQDHGFVAALHKHARDYDIVAADAHFGYYRRRSLVQRLEADVIGPLRAKGYRELWLLGASMGGFGAVGYARMHPEGITGLLLFAPYMGPGEIIEEVKAAGGLCRYEAPVAYVDDREGFARANLGFLRARLCQRHDLAVWLAVGQDDRLLSANALLGGALSPGRYLTLSGGHGWRVWTRAVERIAPQALSQ